MNELKHLKYTSHNSGGFTLIEMLVVAIMMTIGLALSAPGLMGFVNIQRLNSSNNQAFQVLRTTQNNAKRGKNVWQASFRNNADGKNVDWAIHLARADNTVPTSVRWTKLQDQTVINTSYTNFASVGSIRYIQFAQDGSVAESVSSNNYQAKRITFNAVNLSTSIRRCIDVRTLLGGMITAKDSSCQ